MSKQIWVVDTQHSSIVFSVRHMAISTATGHFQRFWANIVTEKEEFEHAAIEFVVATDSVNTNEVYRDEHLKSEAFFQTDRHPNIVFTSATFTKDNDRTYTLSGQLKIKDVEQEMTFPVKFLGIIHHDQQVRAAFEAKLVVRRKDFGLTYNPLMETGGMVLADDVHIEAQISLIKQAI